MSFRNNRIVIVLTFITLLGISLIKFSFKLLGEGFTIIYNNKIQIGIEHIFGISSTGSLILLLFYSLYYIYIELKNYIKENPKDENPVDKEMKKHANLVFRNLLWLFPISLCNIALMMASFISAQFLGLSSFNSIMYFTLGLPVLIVACYIFYNWIKENFIDIIDLKIALHAFWYAMVFITLGLAAIISEANLQTNMEIAFKVEDQDEIKLQLKFQDIVPDYMPESVNIEITNASKETKTLNLSEGDFAKSFQIVTADLKDRKKYYLKKHSYTYFKEISLSPYLIRGSNKVYIKFNKTDIDDSIMEYEIDTDIDILNSGEIIIPDKEYDISL
ncbi:hypothetical protein [Halobacillus mangrovi]|uniref:Uncharacterized protein n=1 Tax=Halobacillus mangrovi TaxID=402384 RepID=A0A1W5ZZV0_9BACI|nr:hypothetical protein [Halobacillus mangrovi]ARI78799.1 hypothetical protein HM131_19015 [Halobacillus mangrovi]